MRIILKRHFITLEICFSGKQAAVGIKWIMMQLRDFQVLLVFSGCQFAVSKLHRHSLVYQVIIEKGMTVYEAHFYRYPQPCV